jgi:hypothetical protein
MTSYRLTRLIFPKVFEEPTEQEVEQNWKRLAKLSEEFNRDF